MLSSKQIRAGRAIINMSQLELALMTGLSLNTIRKLENDNNIIEKSTYTTVAKIRKALEEKGVKFIEHNNSDNIVIGVMYHLPKTST